MDMGWNVILFAQYHIFVSVSITEYFLTSVSPRIALLVTLELGGILSFFKSQYKPWVIMDRQRNIQIIKFLC